jgi:hypothetical protein
MVEGLGEGEKSYPWIRKAWGGGGGEKERGSICLRKGRVDRKSSVDSPNCSVMVKVRHHTTTRRDFQALRIRKEVELTSSFLEKLGNIGQGKKLNKRGI